jgi:hypothetical protein
MCTCRTSTRWIWSIELRYPSRIRRSRQKWHAARRWTVDRYSMCGVGSAYRRGNFYLSTDRRTRISKDGFIQGYGVGLG